MTLAAIHDRLWALYEWATANGRLRWIFIGFLITTCLFYFRNEYLKEESKGRFVPFDGWFYYSATDFKAEVKELSPPGRRMYIGTQLSLDLVYPAIYLLLFGGWLALLTRPYRASLALVRHASLLPLLAAVADLIENATVSYLIWQFDRLQTIDSIVPVAAAATGVKWASLILLTLFLVVALVGGRMKQTG